MSSEKLEMFKTLIKWFHKLNIGAPHETASDLSDGVAMAKALKQIAPDVFTDSWMSQIKIDAGVNWRLKASNIRKIVDCVMDYYSDVLNLTFTDFARIDVVKVAENHDEIELGRLLQLILGFAVNCPRKQDYIKQIMELEESLQRNIMQALQELEAAWQGNVTSRPVSMSISQFDEKGLQNERDILAQKCHDAEQRIALLLDEKVSLQQENAKILQELEKYQNASSTIGDDGISIGPVNPGSARYTELRRQLDTLKDELLQAETSRDDFKIKSKQQESDIAVLRMKVDELNQACAELAILKDEIDVLREASDKLKKCEAQLATYKKKLEDHNDLKRQVKILEERSADYYQQNVQQEEYGKKMAALKSQVEIYQQEIEELNVKLDAEIMKSVKTEFELNNVSAKYTALQREKDSLIDERDTLRETCDELRCNQMPGDSANAMSKELIPPIWKEKIDRLEAENKALRSGTANGELQQFMDESNQRTEKLREQLKQANQKILTLTQAQSEDGKEKGNHLAIQLKQSIELNEQKGLQIDDAQTQITQLQTKNSQLEAALNAREQELAGAEARYRKSVEKAKEIIKSYDPKGLLTEMSVHEKNSEVETENHPPMSSLEEKLMTTAFYRLSTICQRESVDARLAKLAGGSQSFLNRQRQPAARKPMIGKTK